MFWCLKKKKAVVKDDLQRAVKDQPSDGYPSWIPYAENIHKSEGIKMKTRSEYEHGFPKGLVVHFHAGWHLPKGTWVMGLFFKGDEKKRLEKQARKYALRCAKYGAENGFNFLVMDVFGNLYQSRPLTKAGYHAGKSYYPSVGRSVSSKLAGVEILNPGKLTEKNGKFYTWFNYEVPEKYVRYIEEQTGNMAPGFYCKFTPMQEKALENLCLWLYENSPSNPERINSPKVFHPHLIVGHDEVSPGRKDDPGGALSTTMAIFRQRVINKLKGN